MTGGEAAEISGEIKRMDGRMDAAEHGHRLDWYRWLILVLTVLLGAGTSILISTKNQQRSEQRQCEQIAAGIAVWKENIASLTPAGRGQLTASEELYRTFRCPTKGVTP